MTMEQVWLIMGVVKHDDDSDQDDDKSRGVQSLFCNSKAATRLPAYFKNLWLFSGPDSK